MTREEQNQKLIELFRNGGISKLSFDFANNTIDLSFKSTELYQAFVEKFSEIYDFMQSSFKSRPDNLTFDLRLLFDIVGMSIIELTHLPVDDDKISVRGFKITMPSWGGQTYDAKLRAMVNVEVNPVKGEVINDGNYWIKDKDNA